MSKPVQPPARVYLPQGVHAVADVHGACPKKLADQALLLELASTSAVLAGAKVLSVQAHGFGEGQGVAGVALLAESHLTFHSWPEHRFVALDAFMCGEGNPVLALRHFAQALGVLEPTIRTLQRG